MTTERDQLRYSETRGWDPFDWNKFLGQPDWSMDELWTAYQCSCSWVTCACGQQYAVIPRDGSGEPNDATLVALGVRFTNDISRLRSDTIDGWIERREDNRQNAKRTLEQIEERSAFLIRQIYGDE